MLNIVKSTVQKFGEKLGYRIIPEWKMLELNLARHLTVFLKRYDIQAVLDVGANKGGYGNFLRQQAGYQGKILSFEPVKKNFEVLQKQAENDPLWHLFNYALGNEESEKKINVMKSDDFSSFLTPTHDVIDDYVDYNVLDYVETVEIKKLDNVFNSLSVKHDLSNIHLKMDTQGFDLEVLAGANDSLKQISSLQSEVSVNRIYEGMPDYLESIAKLTDHGFELSGLFAVNVDKSLRVVEFDCVMINSSMLKSLN